ncbi:alpha/beta hydrolase [Zhongshania sp. BJYM1]|jgi:acetyl esterase/lipase|uniref:alpha/beta hydrolase n=1 Tax=Zhongshania aquatica TaxID=2965069 RepID=UPI0022B5E2A0|nr:alpha/beta hydrolase [Marortus sp. BJYM1]
MKLLLIAFALLFVLACSTVGFNKSVDVRKIDNIVFKQIDTTALAGDIYIPDIAGPKPAVIVVHGGGWTNRSGKMEGISKKLAHNGFVVFNITYRLAPESRYPAQVNDVSDALVWLYNHADEYEIDPSNISGWGYSAGAHLILMAGLERKSSPHLRSIVAGGTPADLTRWPNSPLVLKLIGEPMVKAEAQWKDASPVNHVSPNSPPVFLYHGQFDKLVEPEQMALMANALKKENIPVETYTVNLLGHILTYAMASGAERSGIEFIRSHEVRDAKIH